MFRTVSDEYKRILGRRKGWVDNGKIITDESPEIKEFKAELRVRGEGLPDTTSLCIHLQKRKTKLGVTEIIFTKQGTLADHNAQSEVTRLIEQYLVIGGERVKAGDSHENDHIIFKNAAIMSNLRHSNPGQDRGPTVITRSVQVTAEKIRLYLA